MKLEDGEIVQDKNPKLKTEEIAKNLDIAESTVRKYFKEIAKAGYQFKRDTTGTRIYQKRDEQAIANLLDIRKRTGVSLEMAATIVANRTDDTGDVQTLTPEVFNETKSNIEKRMLVEFQKEMVNELTLLGNVIQEKISQENLQLKQEIAAFMKSEMERTNTLLLESPLKESIENKIIEENLSMKQEISIMKSELDETNKMLKSFMEQQEQKQTITENQDEKKGFWKKLFS